MHKCICKYIHTHIEMSLSMHICVFSTWLKLLTLKLI